MLQSHHTYQLFRFQLWHIIIAIIISHKYWQPKTFPQRNCKVLSISIVFKKSDLTVTSNKSQQRKPCWERGKAKAEIKSSSMITVSMEIVWGENQLNWSVKIIMQLRQHTLLISSAGLESSVVDCRLHTGLGAGLGAGFGGSALTLWLGEDTSRVFVLRS